ncbi:MAG: GCN5-related N-acetyltransferase [Chloroflexi bacterium]|nr:GCN5-related N-acetyltransferase [Chloroflexota bacterium]
MQLLEMHNLMIEQLHAEQVGTLLPELVALLRDAVDSGASIGFLPPLGVAEADAYWRDVAAAIQSRTRILLAARDEQGIAGSVQVDLAQKPNASHRAEIVKLLVHRRARRQGLGRALLTEAESAAHAAGRSLLVLDTRRGDVAEQLYRGQGYIEAGSIPHYVRNADGDLEDTVIFYRLLAPV